MKDYSLKWQTHLTALFELTCVVGGTKTGVVVDSIHAGCTVFTVVVFAVVSVDFASGAFEAQRTGATTQNEAHIMEQQAPCF